MDHYLLRIARAARCVCPIILLGISSIGSSQTTTDGPLKMEVITAYNFVVDSNVESPSSFSPSAAHLGVKIINTGAVTLTNVVVNMGDLINPLTSSGTPGIFPSRTVTVGGSQGYSGTFALQMPGGAADAVRTIPSLAPGQSVVQYFFVTYPLKDSAGNSVAGAAPVTSDDLWLNYDIWATALEGATTRRVGQVAKVTMRNEISAMANKIWPNTTSKVPDRYLDAIQQSLGWRPNSGVPQAGSTAQLEGIWYDLGNVGAGFDNNGDGLPDRNAWMQPVGDPAKYDPLAMRLVKCYGIVIVKLNNGTEQLIPFEDKLYFENIAANNTGAVGLVFYEFLPLAAGRTAMMSPYQEVASGFDNEKFNGDYGASSVSLSSAAPAVTFNKSGPALVAGGSNVTYSMTATNSGSSSIGIPLQSLPFVFEDAIPAGLVYVASSATTANTIPAANSVSVSWSTDNGLTWVTTEPTAASVTRVRWTLGSAFAPSTTATVGFQATVPVSYPTLSIDNTAVIKLGPTGSLATSTVTTRLTGNNSIGDLVWKDDNRDSIKGASESGIPNITVNLYSDINGNGVVDANDPLYGTTLTNASGIYTFASLPDGNFVAVVDNTDTDLPAGYTLPNSASSAIAAALDPTRATATAVNFLTADWPFIPALVVVKTTTPTTYGAGSLISYTLDVENHATPVAAKATPVQTSWSTTVTGNRAAQNPTNAQGAPDSVYARLDQTASADNLANSGLTFANPVGTITKVELLFNAYLSQPLLDDRVDVNIGGTLFSTLTTAQLNATTAPASIRAVDITSKNATWTWILVQALTANLKTNKTSAGDPGILWVDSIGFRVTTTAAAPAVGTYGPSTMDPLPLVDTYDSTKLQYISASVAPTSTSAGTITWSNLGPLNAGTRKTITVIFRALTPPDINANGEPDTTTTLNTATSTGGLFVSGRPTNPASGNVTVTINPRGSIGDLVWWDINANGIKDVTEPGLSNVIVNLDNGAQTRTDSTGYYLFPNLIDGTYTVTVDTNTLPWTSPTQTKDPDATVNNASTVVINNNDGISTNNSYLDRDFGYDSALNVISGTVFRDNNGNGVQDSGEISLAGVTVTLTGTSGATITTDSLGNYSFGSLANGTYTVTVTQPASTIQTLDPDATVNNATTKTVTGGNLYPNNNFAYQPSGTLTLGDTLYIDWNGNGSQDTGEEGIASVDVFLYQDANGDGLIDPSTDALRATSVTSATGVYGFTALPAGNYIVVVNTADPQFPAGVIQIQDYDGTRDSRAVVNLTVSLTTADFGYKPQGTASIGDTVFLDANGNGVKDAIESGIANVGVTLYEDTNNNGVIDAATDAVLATATTSSSGTYLFTGLAAGNYLVDVNEVAASIPSDAYGNKYRLTTSDPHDVTLATGQAYLTADFGFAAAATIGDFVFFDSNGNATQDLSETGIPNVTVQLFLDANQDGVADSPTPLATTTTATGSGANPAGFYQFTNLAAGTYFVKVLTTSLPQSGGQPIPLTADPDRDGVPVNDNTYPSLPAGDNADSLVIVSLGGNYTGADFGYKPPGSIGDFVWLDLDQDGVQDAGEPGVANVTVNITNGTITYTATTDFDGYWSVANIPNGAWTVSVPASNFTSGAALEGTATTYDADGGLNSSVAIVLTNGVVNLAVGNLGLDFGYKLNGIYALSGTVATHDTRVVGTADDIDDFFDDGVDKDAGALDETELSGLVIYLYTTGGRFLGSTTTDAAGNYRFSGLPAGTYRVIIGALADSTLTTTAANNPAVSSVNSSSGTSVIQTLAITTASVSNVDFAFISNVNFDYGDLPLSYAMTTLNQDGARHIIPVGGATVYLGGAPDADTNGVPTSLANGDDLLGTDDENGITPLSIASWTNGVAGGSIQASVTGSGWLVGWIDWNHDGNFLDPGELVVSQAVSTGTTTLSLTIPAGTIGAGSESWLARFRIFTTQPAYPLFSYTGSVTNGEVEDYLIEKPVGASIGDMVWNDANSNGVLNSGESGIGGINVVLRDNTNTIIATQVTGNGAVDVDGDGTVDPAGYYRFSGLSAGNFTVTVSTPPVGFTPSYDENGIGTPHTTAVTLVAAAQHLTADFGYAPLLANISGQVRYDTDADGDFNDPDSGAAVVKIQLWTDPNGDGNPADGVQVAETYTSATGNYIFTGVASGNYCVVEINLPNSISTADVVGLNDDRVAVVMIGTNVIGRDFLDTLPPVYAISGTVYDDADATNDNVIGAGDTPLAAITVKLYFDRDGNGIISAGDSELSSTVTNTAGSYSFTGLPAGNYIVQETDPAGAVSDWDAAGNLTDNQISVALVNANVTNRDFLDDGYLGAISGFVQKDVNHDGSVDGVIAGVVLTLKTAAGNDVDSDLLTSGVQPTTTTSAVNGSYSFINLVPGSYKVVETQPAGYASSSDKDGGNLNLIGDVTLIVVSSGQTNSANNFVEFLQECPDTWAAWQALWPLGGANTPTANPDGDRYNNLIEYAFCLPPNSGVGETFCLEPSLVVSGGVAGTFNRTAGGPLDVTYVLEYSATLGNPTVWQSLTLNSGNTTLTNNGDGSEKVTLSNLETLTGLTAGKGVVRIRADLSVGSVSATTEAHGWTKTNLGICCRTYNNPYLSCAEFAGTVDGVSGQTLAFTTSAGSVDLATLLISGQSYFLEVTSGDNEGHRFDIVSASGSVLTLATDADVCSGTPPFNTWAGALPASLIGDKVALHRHKLLGEQYPVTGFFAAGIHTDADQIQTFAAGVWTTYWLYTNGGLPKWVKVGDLNLDNQAATVLPPGQGSFILRRNTATTILAYGEVRDNDFINPLCAGTNLTAGGYPLDQSATGSGSRAMNLGTGFFGSRDFKTADSFFVWKGDAVADTNGYDTYFLLNRDTVIPPQIKWVKQGDVSLASRDAAVLLLGNASVFIRVKNDMHTYLVPSPWNP